MAWLNPETGLMEDDGFMRTKPTTKAPPQPSIPLIFKNGARGYIVGSSLLVGLYVGLNPETKALVFVQDGDFKTYHKWQVSPLPTTKGEK